MPPKKQNKPNTPATTASNKKKGTQTPAPAPVASKKKKATPPPAPVEAEGEELSDEDDEAFESGEDDDEEGEDDDMSDEDDEFGEDDEDDDEDGDDAGGLGAMSPADMLGLMAMINKMKQQDGPIISTVHLLADGSTKDVTLDMTPRSDEISKLLGGKCTFVGQYPPPLSATIMMVKEQSKSLPINKHILAPPYDKDAGQLRGDFVLVRMDEENNPDSLTIAEYEAFKANGGVDPDADANGDDKGSKKKKKGTKSAPVVPTAPAKKRGLTTEEAVALAKKKRKSMGLPENMDEPPSDEEQQQQETKVVEQKKTNTKQAKAATPTADTSASQAKKKQKRK